MKIDKYFDKKENKEKYKARFQLNEKEFSPRADTRRKLLDLIDEIRAQEHRAKFKLEVPTAPLPTVAEVFAKHQSRLEKEKDRKKIGMFRRVSETFLKLLPLQIKMNELKKAHFQKYIDLRLQQKNSQSEKFILPETVNKELSSLSVAFKNVARDFPELEDVPPPVVPKLETDTNRRRERLVDMDKELAVLLEFLRRPHRNTKTAAARRNLADDLEIRYQTGLRRAEAALLKNISIGAAKPLCATFTELKPERIRSFFPLTRRAVEVIESRLDLDSEYIFSTAGKPNEGMYRTLKTVCAKLGLKYGTHEDGGFVPHDLRHNFATEIIRVTDIETAKNLTGHTGDHIMTYLHTDERAMREAMRRREGIDLAMELNKLYEGVKGDLIDLPKFIETVGFLMKNG